MSNPPDDGCVPGSRREVVGGLRPRWHRYTSTACRHHPHVASERCRVTCKFCAAACACYCHTGGPWWRWPVKALRYATRRVVNRLMAAR